jgi:hypothetical protein
MYELSRRLDEICLPLGVEIDGALEVRMSSEDTEHWLREIEDAARKAAEVKRPQIVDWPSAYVTVIPIGASERTSFLGPMERGAGWPRLVGILQKKAGQAAFSGASWLRLDVKDGMFQLTDWSRMDLRGKLSVLADHLPHALQGVDWLDGVVVTSGACQYPARSKNRSCTTSVRAMRSAAGCRSCGRGRPSSCLSTPGSPTRGRFGSTCTIASSCGWI